MHRVTTRSMAIPRRRRFHFLQAFLGAALFSLISALGWYAGLYTLLHFLISCALVLAFAFSVSLVLWFQEVRSSRVGSDKPLPAPTPRPDDWLSVDSLGRSDRPAPARDFVLASGKIEMQPGTSVPDSSGCFWRWVPATGEFFFSPGLLELLGFEAGVLAPQFSSWEGLCHPEDRDLAAARIKDCAERRAGNSQFEVRLRRHCGEWLWISCNVQRMEDSKEPGKVYFNGLCRDVHVRKQLERDLNLRETLYRRLLELTGAGYARFTISGALLDFNSGFLEITGRSEEELQEANIEQLVTKESRPAQDKAFHALRHGAESAEARVELGVKGGGTVEVIMHALLEAGNTDNKIVWTVFQRHDAQSQSADRVVSHKPASDWEERSRVLGKISHEVRTPLNALVGAADLALGESRDPALRHTLQLIRHSAHELFNIFSDFLDISRLDAGRLRFSEEVLDLPYLVDKVFSIFSLHAEEKALSFLTQIGEGVPTSLCGDGDRLKQVFMNLVGNAVKFTPREGAIIIQIDLDSDRKWEKDLMDDGRVLLHFTVGDTGVGIPRERLSSIFEPYTELAPGENTGMGLAVAKRIVEAMGGRIWVDSTPGQGTALHFTAHFGLPVSKDLSNGTVMRPQPKHERLGLRVLLAEDNVVNQRVVARILEKHGCIVTLAGNGEQALEVLHSSGGTEAFDLVLMDCDMPRLDGFTATIRIREMEDQSSGARLPVIALTAHAMEGDRERCLSAGMDEFLAKPLDIDVLLDALKRWGRRSEALS